jgi:hypothetical protein
MRPEALQTLTLSEGPHLRTPGDLESIGKADTLPGVIALLGRKDEPTDGLRDYCVQLGEALSARGVTFETTEVRWERIGWFAALAQVWTQSSHWRDRWVLFQYTALMWSSRGFPFAVPVILGILKFRRCHVAVIFHDVYAAPGPRRIQRIRVALQRRIMRCAYWLGDRSILPVPLESVSWLPAPAQKASFIPIGANIPSIDDLSRGGFVLKTGPVRMVAVFGVTAWPPSAQQQEIEAITHAVRQACAELGELRLVVMGRGAKEAEAALRTGLSGSRVALTVDGLLDGRDVSARLCGCDALLFVRGSLSSRRGSGLAGIACGLPIVG